MAVYNIVVVRAADKIKRESRVYNLRPVFGIFREINLFFGICGKGLLLKVPDHQTQILI